MANPQNAVTVSQRSAKADSAQAGSMAIMAPIAGWLVPGLGHFIQRRWIRGILLMLAVFIMFFAGLGMQGKVYSFNTGDLLDILGSSATSARACCISWPGRWTGVSATFIVRWRTTAPSTSSWRDC